MNKIKQKIDDYKKLHDATNVQTAAAIGISPNTLWRTQKNPRGAKVETVEKFCAKYGGLFGGLSFEDFIE